jgi:flagellar hook-associated protein 2
MASISSTGLGSGLDVTSIVSSLMSVERQPLTKMQSAASDLQTKLSAYGKVQSYVSTLRDAANKLSKSATWGTTTSTSADTSVVTASSNSTSAVAGTYSVSVSALATSQAVASGSFSDKTATLGSGSLSIELGSWSADQSSFSAKSGSSPVSVSVVATDTLADIRDKINKADAGVKATLVTDTTGTRLVMRSVDTGVENGFRITAADDDLNNTNSSGLSALAFDPSASVTSMTRTQAAGNAQAQINGLSVTSASNTLSDVVEGVSLKLNKVSTTPVDVSVATDTDTLKTAITDFAKAYNDLATYLTNQTKYDPTTKASATFQGDSAMNSLRSGLRALGTSSSGSSSTLQRLTSMGLDPQADGTLKTDSSKLTAALGNVSELKKLFVTSGSSIGMGEKLRSWGDKLLDIDGSVTARQASLQKQVSANSKQQDQFGLRMTSVEARMKAQYTALDTTMSKISGLSNYVTQQLTAIANTKSA